jgi:hypothetical protein
MATNTKSLYACEILVNGKPCGKEGDQHQTFWCQLPDGRFVKACGDHVHTLTTGYKAAKVTGWRYATVWATETAYTFTKELAARLPFKKGQCSVPGCNREIGPHVLLIGTDRKALCNDCTAAADLVATRFQREWIRPLFNWQALKRVEAAVASAADLALAQLAPKPERKPEPKPAPQAPSSTEGSTAKAAAPAPAAETKSKPDKGKDEAKEGKGRRRHRGGKGKGNKPADATKSQGAFDKARPDSGKAAAEALAAALVAPTMGCPEHVTTSLADKLRAAGVVVPPKA